MKIATIKGYDIYQDDDGFYGMTKVGEAKPHCAYKYLWAMLKLKNI